MCDLVYFLIYYGYDLRDLRQEIATIVFYILRWEIGKM